MLNMLAKWAAGLGIAGSLAQSALYTVDGGERAVLFDRFRGVLPESTTEGMHVLVRACDLNRETSDTGDVCSYLLGNNAN